MKAARWDTKPTLKIMKGGVSYIVIEYEHGEDIGKTGMMSYLIEDHEELVLLDKHIREFFNIKTPSVRENLKHSLYALYQNFVMGTRLGRFRWSKRLDYKLYFALFGKYLK